MRIRIHAILVAASAAALVTGLSAGASSAAAKTWSIKPGGAITGNAPSITFTDTTNGLSITCKPGSFTGNLKSGSGLAGSDAGGITGGKAGCAGGLTAVIKDVPWHINLLSYNSSTGVTSGTVSHSEVKVSGPGCTFVVDGTSGGASDGRVPFTYTNSTGAVKVHKTGGNLHIFKVSGCGGMVANGNGAAVSGTFTITPKQTITSP
jgi:hypothetical protein